MVLLLGGIAIGCVLVLYPFVSSLLWAAILVFTTWPVCEWLRHHMHLRRGAAAGVMVALTAVVLVLPLALAAPGGANDVNHLRGVIEDALRAGLPDSPDWVFDIPLIGPTLGSLWNRWAADVRAESAWWRLECRQHFETCHRTSAVACSSMTAMPLRP